MWRLCFGAYARATLVPQTRHGHLRKCCRLAATYKGTHTFRCWSRRIKMSRFLQCVCGTLKAEKSYPRAHRVFSFRTRLRWSYLFVCKGVLKTDAPGNATCARFALLSCMSIGRSALKVRTNTDALCCTRLPLGAEF